MTICSAINQNVIIDIPIADERQVVSVHKDAVITQQDGSHTVFVVENDMASSRTTTLGEAVGNRFEVKFGLESGDSVVVRGNERLQPGQSVAIIEQ